MTRDDVMALAGRCVEGQATVYEFAESVAELRSAQLVEVMFGECADRPTARQHLKSALHAATSPDHARRLRRGEA